MSNQINDTLFDQARELAEYWVGTMWARLIEQDIDNNDLEALKYHIAQSKAEMSLQESEANDVY